MRDLIEVLNGQFDSNHRRALDLLGKASDEILFQKPAGLEESRLPLTFGENIVRSAAVIEMAFGGITTRLWDDPFEWTLPEELSSVGRVRGYLEEVAEYRSNAISFLRSDDDLKRVTPAPETLRPILEILVDAISRSSTHLGQAATILHLLQNQAKQGLGETPPL